MAYSSSGWAQRIVYGVSLALHAGGGVWLSSIPNERPPEPIVIQMRTIEQAPEPPPPPPPPPEPEAPPAPAPPKATPPKAAPAAEPPPAAAAPSFGLSLAGVSGGGPGGVAVPIGDPNAPVRRAERTLDAPPVTAATKDGCAEPETKAKASQVPRPIYTDEARAAAIEGKVRVELSLDETGAVVSTKVLEGLGHGLDESAARSLQEGRFTPATRCGAPVASTFVVAVRFSL